MESIADELYVLHPTRFVEARDAVADEALTAGEGKLAAQIAALRRPTLSAWASNLLVHSKPAQVTRLLRLGEGLRQAHHNADGTQLRRLNRRQHTLVGALSRQARDLAAGAGHPLGEAAQRKVEQTLHAALADPAAAQQWASGRLVKALVPPVGFTAAAVAEAPTRQAPAPSKARGRKTPPRPERPDMAGPKSAREQRPGEARRRKLVQAQRAAEAAEQQARQREEEHHQAQATVERTESTLRQLEERATELAQQLHATVELRRRVRNDLDNARNRAAETDHAAQQARRAAETARDRAERLTK
ncbi:MULTISPECIES: hypothetical protein [Streptomyces]|uniref:hypothetical protein n=1 Tax=Streptomyces TaxID=1883 RepID=UPI00117DCADD|nr:MULTISPECIES: hypothetical protein [Streptomyces]